MLTFFSRFSSIVAIICFETSRASSSTDSLGSSATADEVVPESQTSAFGFVFFAAEETIAWPTRFLEVGAEEEEEAVVFEGTLAEEDLPRFLNVEAEEDDDGLLPDDEDPLTVDEEIPSSIIYAMLNKYNIIIYKK